MGWLKSLKKAVGKLAPVAGLAAGFLVPGVGTALGGAIGGGAQSLLSGKGASGVARSALAGYGGGTLLESGLKYGSQWLGGGGSAYELPQSAPQGRALPGGAQMMPASYDGQATPWGSGPGAYPLTPTAGAMGPIATAGGLILSATRSGAMRIAGLMSPLFGKISPKKAMQMVKTLGLQAAAAGIGIGVVELAQLVAQESGKKSTRRGRGITAAQLRTTQSTIGKVVRINDRLACSYGKSVKRSTARKCA